MIAGMMAGARLGVNEDSCVGVSCKFHVSATLYV